MTRLAASDKGRVFLKACTRWKTQQKGVLVEAARQGPRKDWWLYRDVSSLTQPSSPMWHSKTVPGVSVPHFFPDDAVASALTCEPSSGEVFVATHPKCGTTWVQYVVYVIFHDGRPAANLGQFLSASPFLELFGASAVQTMHRPGTIETHLPFNEKTFSSHNKYIYVARNPYDVCVFAYHQSRNMMVAEEDVLTVGEPVKRFVSGSGSYGCYLRDSLLPWYRRRHDINFLFLTYEDIYANIKAHVTKIAEFLGPGYGKRISRDPAMLQRVIDMTSKERMGPLFKNFLVSTIEFAVRHRKCRNAPVSQELESLLNILKSYPLRYECVREGSVGSYKSFLRQNHRNALKDRISARTSGGDVMSLWVKAELS